MNRPSKVSRHSQLSPSVVHRPVHGGYPSALQAPPSVAPSQLNYFADGAEVPIQPVSMSEVQVAQLRQRISQVAGGSMHGFVDIG